MTRREPVQLVLAGPTIHDAEMGERRFCKYPTKQSIDLILAYWPPETTRPSARSQGVSQAFDEGDDMPLLPRTRKRLLGEDGAESTPPGTSPGPFAPPTQTHSTLRFGMTQIQRKTRRQSVESDVSTANLVPIESVRTRSGPKNGKAKVKEPIVLEDDDENDPTPPTRSTRSDVTSTLQGDASRSVTPRSTQTATAGRRKLLPADDDDGGMVRFASLRVKG